MKAKVGKMFGKMRKENGQSMVELVLVLPFLLLLLVATVEAGFALRDYLVLQSVNREGVRWAARTPPTGGEPDKINNFVQADIDQVFNRIGVAAQAGGLRMDEVDIIVTHLYIDPAGDAGFGVYASPGTDLTLSKLVPQDMADANLDKHMEIEALRGSAGLAGPDEMVIVEVFYTHKALWGLDIADVGPFREDWLMYAQSSMRMVGTGR